MDKDLKKDKIDEIDEFETLLENFIKQEREDSDNEESNDDLGEEADDAEEEEHHTILNIDGYNYTVEAVDEAEKAIELTNLDVSIDLESYPSECLLLDTDGIEMQYTFKRKRPEDSDVARIHYYLYKAGTALPMLNDTARAYNRVFDVSVPIEEPGEYVLILANTMASGNLEQMGFKQIGSYIYRRIHAHAIDNYQSVESTKVRLTSRRSVAISSKPIDVRVGLKSFHNPASDIERDESRNYIMQMKCYDSALRRVGESAVMEMGLTVGKAKQQQFTLNPYCLWEEGEYRLVAMTDGYPAAIFKLTIDSEKMEITPDKSEDNIELELIARYAEHFIDWQQRVATIGGFGEGRRKLTKLLRKRVFNDIRKRAGIEADIEPLHFALIGENKEAMYKLAKALPRIFDFRDDTLVRYDASELIPQNGQQNSYVDISELFVNSQVPYVCGVSAFFTADGQRVLKRLLKEMASSRNAVIIGCTRQEFAQLQEYSSEVAKKWPERCRLKITNYTPMEAMETIGDEMLRMHWTLTEEAKVALVEQMKSFGKLWSEREVVENVSHNVIARAEKRVTDNILAGVKLSDEALSTIKAIDVKIEVEQAGSFEESMRPLMGMTGLDNLKSRLSEYFDMMRLNKMRRDAGLPTEAEAPHHVMFTGNPGTGKTTVAGHIGKIYKALGLLSKGEVIRADRSRIVGEFIGQSEKNMAALIEEAQGNVLFIDEAYALCTDAKDGRDFGRHALNVLLPHLSNPNANMVVILAGYDKDMDNMLMVNQGMAGRFPQRFHFDDYTAEQLITIGERIVEKQGYRFSDDAHREYCKAVNAAVATKGETWSNARWVEQLINTGIRPALSRRVMRLSHIDAKALSTIEASDVKAAAAQMATMSHEQPRRAVGFAV